MVLMRSIGKGWHYCKDSRKLIYQENGPLSDLADDARAMKILAEIANELDSSIVMTPDFSSLHQDGRRPVLDLGLFIQDNRVQFGFSRSHAILLTLSFSKVH